MTGRMWLGVALLLAGVAMVGARPSAQRAPEPAPVITGAAGRGVASSEAAERPLGRGAFQPTLWWGDEMFPTWPYPAGDAAYADLTGQKIKGYINEITAIARKSRDDGNQYWGRITGSPYDRMKIGRAHV